MTASRVVEHLNVVEDIAAGQISGLIDLTPDPLALEQLEVWVAAGDSGGLPPLTAQRLVESVNL